MAISVMYVTPEDKKVERFGFKNENEARKAAYSYVADGCTNVVMRFTSQENEMTITHWAECFDETPEPVIDTANPLLELATDLIYYTIPQILLEGSRRAWRFGEPS